ncbi:MAG: trigger factor [Desulfobacteraceae bacterium]|jgi:trigger factor
MMKVTVEDKSSVKKILHIEVPQKEVVQELDNAYAQLKKTAKIKGFRPGKAPRSVLTRLYGKDVNADVTGKLIQAGFMEAIKETELKIVGSPKVEPPELKDQTPYAFEAEVEIHPEIADIEYKGLALNKTKYNMSESEVELQLNMLRKNLAKREKIEEDRPIKLDDVAVIDYEGFKGGEPFEPTKKTENFIIKIGDGQIVKDLDDGIIGMKVDDERQIEVTFPDDYYKEELVGQQVLFKVKLNEIRQEVLPEVDDEFAKSISDNFDSLESLKAEIRKNLLAGYNKRTEQEMNEQIFKQLLEQTQFEVPDTMVEGELEHILKDAERSFEQSNRSFDELGLSKEILGEKYRPTAEKQVRRHLILNKIIEQEKLELSDEELDQGFQEMADTYQQPVDHIKGYYSQNKEGLELFKHTMLEKKALNLIIDSGKISEVEPTEKTDTPDGDNGE